MPTKPRAFRFIGKLEPNTVIGERVVMQVPLAPQHAGPTQSVPLRGFIKHVETQILGLFDKYGEDLEGFALHLERGLPTAIVFTRPMDTIELTQIRAARAKEQQQRDDNIERELVPHENSQPTNAPSVSASDYSHLVVPAAAPQQPSNVGVDDRYSAHSG